MKIFCKFPTINISKLNFWLVRCIAKNLIWTTSKAVFSIFGFLLHSHIPDFQVVIFRTNIVLSQQTIHQWKAYLFSSHMMYKYQFKKNWPLWLVLWSRVTYNKFKSQAVLLVNIWGQKGFIWQKGLGIPVVGCRCLQFRKLCIMITSWVYLPLYDESLVLLIWIKVPAKLINVNVDVN